MKNTLINRAVTKKIARALGELNASVVYVGGAIVRAELGRYKMGINRSQPFQKEPNVLNRRAPQFL